MKLDFLTSDQWSKLQGMYSDLARRLACGFLRCGNCGRRQDLHPRTAEEYLREGWPVCCEGTLHGGTMNYYANQRQLERELAITNNVQS